MIEVTSLLIQASFIMVLSLLSTGNSAEREVNNGITSTRENPSLVETEGTFT